MNPPPLYGDDWILAKRPPRNPVSADRPYAFLVEPEAGLDGAVVDVATIFLTNRECPFRCLMCDLWKNTLESSVAPGQITSQIRLALQELTWRAEPRQGPVADSENRPLTRLGSPKQQHLKLYNAGNFFDAQAIPPDDYPAIAELAAPFARVIVESHPRLVGRRCWDFQRLLECDLEVAMGLETVHPEVLPRLNKQMTLDDFARATRALHDAGVAVRAFILVRPPFLSDAEGLEWAKRSLDYAFSLDVECCTLIPTRAGNGAIEELGRQGHFAPPSLDSLENALEYGLSLDAGRVFLDLWDIGKTSADPARVARMAKMNLTQRLEA